MVSVRFLSFSKQYATKSHIQHPFTSYVIICYPYIAYVSVVLLNSTLVNRLFSFPFQGKYHIGIRYKGTKCRNNTKIKQKMLKMSGEMVGFLLSGLNYFLGGYKFT